MPVITVALRTGRTIEQKRELVSRLTAAFVETCGGTADGVWVALQEIPPEGWGIGGALQSDLMGLTSPPQA
ncbi:4-oxalocrotonate tautomerase family protein [Amycolatopsis sp. NPDC088138]|uniref:tautomerase family protein n=1 Tax=Amycolatopsis sp. NPDC088138 TaxID=3363938 RepID=UPI00381A7390